MLSDSPEKASAQAHRTPSWGRERVSSTGSLPNQPRKVLISPRISVCQAIHSIRSAARSRFPEARAWLTASGISPFCSYHSLARRCSSGTSSALSRSRRWRSKSAKRW